ncbi:UNKNOWN [Stylonychia lemnae]|uniref:Dickkopf N-terminal cysteine-rich domain-containing protein n=1 Tax=Stylonychia lemnae TaxID=5949 RepID=A0A078ATH4_STYLE|nr:UNKNOWN [Stylonychia lemnae]|eukprot:CDW84482.1 UNKNOWN [Stylonychia lemnae]
METDIVSCPRLTCSENLGDGVCFMHQATNPVEWIKLASCPSGQICDATSDYAWYDVFKQSIEQANELGKSSTWKKLTKSRCDSSAKFRQNLLPGRYCQSNYECSSFNCTDNICKGQASGTSCSYHDQCDSGLACIASKSFPFVTTCNSYKKQGEQCESTHDCDLKTVCWYVSREDFQTRTKKCMAKYQLPIGDNFGWAPVNYDTVKDILWNGQVCSTGFAIPFYENSTVTRPLGMCVNITKVVSDQGTYNNPISDVPKCLAANKGSFCNYFYNSVDSFKTRCYCAADGSLGYCPLPNFQAMRNFTAFDVFIQGNSTNCHTKDRDNLKAHFECGIGDGTVLRQYTNARILKENWNFAQSSKVLSCLQNYMPSSYTNLQYSTGVIIQLFAFALGSLCFGINLI